jgi:hypothetical protein
MSSRAVPDRADSLEVHWRLDGGEKVDSRSDVEERLRPAAAVPDAPVLEIPGSEAAPGEVLAEPRHQRPVVARPPVTAVDDHDDRVRSALVRDEQLGELARVVSVAVQRALDAPSLPRCLPGLNTTPVSLRSWPSA